MRDGRRKKKKTERGKRRTDRGRLLHRESRPRDPPHAALLATLYA